MIQYKTGKRSQIVHTLMRQTRAKETEAYKAHRRTKNYMGGTLSCKMGTGREARATKSSRRGGGREGFGVGFEEGRAGGHDADVRAT